MASVPGAAITETHQPVAAATRSVQRITRDRGPEQRFDRTRSQLRTRPATPMPVRTGLACKGSGGAKRAYVERGNRATEALEVQLPCGFADGQVLDRGLNLAIN